MIKMLWKKLRVSLLFTLTLLIIIFFAIKNVLVVYIIQSKINDFNNNYYANIFVENIKFKGLSKLAFDKIILTAHNDTVLNIDTIFLKINPFKAIFGEIKIKELFLNNAIIKLQTTDTSGTLQMLFKTKNLTRNDTVESKVIDYRKRVNLLFKVLFNFLPEKSDIKNIKIYYFKNQNLFLEIKIPFVETRNSILKAPVYITGENNLQILNFACIINSKELSLKIKCTSRYKPDNYFPGFSNIRLKAHFDTANFSIVHSENADAVVLKGVGELNKLIVHQPSIAFSEIDFDRLKMQYSLSIKDYSIELDSSTYVLVNKLKVHPFVSYQSYPEKKLKIKLNEPNIDAGSFFTSLPQGLFPNTNNIKATGNLSYRLNFEINFNCIDSLKIESELLPKKLKIISFGNLNIAKLDSEFIHAVYEKGEFVENIHISYSNTNYVPFKNISPYLINALLCTEDGAFFWHKGFIQDAFREAMIENIKKKRFARGGSTITMQLVKNLYLNRYKVISRKLEEMLIVWLIENLRLTSKERMFELYLNIIEFGPRIYGISKASWFYFMKKPNEINLPEAIFLASIVPKPKHFASSFDSTGVLKPQVQEFLKFVAQKMFNKQMINEQEFLNFNPNIELKGASKDFLRKKEGDLFFENK